MNAPYVLFYAGAVAAGAVEHAEQNAQWLVGFAVCCAFFMLGTIWGCLLNLSQMHRMRKWAESVTDRLDIK